MIASPADIAYFIEIATTLNISRASERLGVSQPSLSLAIRRLETSIGTELLIRSKRGVTLTKAGMQLLAHARQLNEAWDNIRSRTLASAHEVRGVYTIGCHASVGLTALGHVLPALMAENAALDIRLRHDLSRKIAEDVISMKVDIGIVVNPVAHPDLMIHRLCRDEICFWHTGRAKTKACDIEGNEAVLICDPDLAQSQNLMGKLKKAGISFARTIQSDNLEVIAELTAKGAGIGILPGQVAVRASAKLKKLEALPLFHDEHCLIYRVENKKIKSMQTIAGAIRAFYENIA